jgi:hypothetical protein
VNSLTRITLTVAAFSVASVSAASAQAQTWKFAVSGDSRNCGDVVMPAIAVGVKQSGADFYWHLGDLRLIRGVDEDINHQPEHIAKHLETPEYEPLAWDDFIRNQMDAFAGTTFYLGIGNHETYGHMNHDKFVAKFSKQLDLPNLRAQRLKDNPRNLQPMSYYHWIERGVDFIYLDNATNNAFDGEQVVWLEKTLQSDAADPQIHTFVVGMHEALPESLSKDHAMDASQSGIASGLRVYQDLLAVQNRDHKRVYVLASHSHYYMEGVFNTQYWRTHGGVLPGWIVGTAGAELYDLPLTSAGKSTRELEHVYGFLTGTVNGSGDIQFDFQQLAESDVPAAITSRYTPRFVHWCFTENTRSAKIRNLANY